MAFIYEFVRDAVGLGNDHEVVPGEENGDDDGRLYFQVPEAQSLTHTQTLQLMQTGFSQGVPFELNASGITRPNDSNRFEMRSLRNLCTVKANTVRLVRVNPDALPPISKYISKVIRDSILDSRERHQPEYELVFDFSSECSAVLTCYFGAYVADTLNVRTRADIPGAKSWAGIHAPPGHNQTFRSSNYGLTLVEIDPVFNWLKQEQGSGRKVPRKNVYDVVVVTTPVPDAPDAVPSPVSRVSSKNGRKLITRKVDAYGVTGSSPTTHSSSVTEDTLNTTIIADNDECDAIEMTALDEGQGSPCKSDIEAKPESDWEKAKRSMVGRAPDTVAALIGDHHVVKCEFTMMNLTELPELRCLEDYGELVDAENDMELTSTHSSSGDDEDSLPSGRGSDEIRHGDPTYAKSDDDAVMSDTEDQDEDDVLQCRLSDHNKKNIPTKKPKYVKSTTAITTSKNTKISKKKLKEFIAWETHLALKSQKVEWNGMILKTQSIFGDTKPKNTGNDNGDTSSVDCGKQGLSSVGNTDKPELKHHVDEDSEEEEDMESMCVICLGEQREVACYPCRHLCVCADCSVILKDQQVGAMTQNRGNDRILPGELLKCPICRARVSVLIHLRHTNTEA
jgi:hypothetical protein